MISIKSLINGSTIEEYHFCAVINITLTLVLKSCIGHRFIEKISAVMLPCYCFGYLANIKNRLWFLSLDLQFHGSKKIEAGGLQILNIKIKERLPMKNNIHELKNLWN